MLPPKYWYLTSVRSLFFGCLQSLVHSNAFYLCHSDTVFIATDTVLVSDKRLTIILWLSTVLGLFYCVLPVAFWHSTRIYWVLPLVVSGIGYILLKQVLPFTGAGRVRSGTGRVRSDLSLGFVLTCSGCYDVFCYSMFVLYLCDGTVFSSEGRRSIFWRCCDVVY